MFRFKVFEISLGKALNFSVNFETIDSVNFETIVIYSDFEPPPCWNPTVG